MEYEEPKYTVTSIGDRAFGACGLLASVLLPNATTIGAEVFIRCDNLKTVNLSFEPMANPDCAG